MHGHVSWDHEHWPGHSRLPISVGLACYDLWVHPCTTGTRKMGGNLALGILCTLCMVYPTSWCTLLHALTIPCMSQTSWMLARHCPSHLDHTPCVTSPCQVYLLWTWPPLVWGALMRPTPLPSLLAPHTISEGEEVKLGKMTYHRECSYKQMK